MPCCRSDEIYGSADAFLGGLNFVTYRTVPVPYKPKREDGGRKLVSFSSSSLADRLKESVGGGEEKIPLFPVPSHPPPHVLWFVKSGCVEKNSSPTFTSSGDVE